MEVLINSSRTSPVFGRYEHSVLEKLIVNIHTAMLDDRKKAYVKIQILGHPELVLRLLTQGCRCGVDIVNLYSILVLTEIANFHDPGVDVCMRNMNIHKTAVSMLQKCLKATGDSQILVSSIYAFLANVAYDSVTLQPMLNTLLETSRLAPGLHANTVRLLYGIYQNHPEVALDSDAMKLCAKILNISSDPGTIDTVLALFLQMTQHESQLHILAGLDVNYILIQTLCELLVSNKQDTKVSAIIEILGKLVILDTRLAHSLSTNYSLVNLLLDHYAQFPSCYPTTLLLYNTLITHNPRLLLNMIFTDKLPQLFTAFSRILDTSLDPVVISAVCLMVRQLVLHGRYFDRFQMLQCRCLTILLAGCSTAPAVCWPTIEILLDQYAALASQNCPYLPELEAVKNAVRQYSPSPESTLNSLARQISSAP